MEFALVSLLVVGLFLGALQVALVLHTRNVIVESAAEGARTAANADRQLVDGEERTRELLRRTLSGRLVDGLEVSASYDEQEVDGEPVQTVRMTVTGPVPLFLPFLGDRRLRLVGHAFREAQ